MVGCGIGSHHLSPSSAKYQSTVYQTEVSSTTHVKKAGPGPRLSCGKLRGKWLVVGSLSQSALESRPSPLSRTPHCMIQLVGSLTSVLKAVPYFCTHSQFQHTTLPRQLGPRFSGARCDSHIHQASFVLLTRPGTFLTACKLGIPSLCSLVGYSRPRQPSFPLPQLGKPG